MRIAVLGATSGIAEAVARRYASRGAVLLLVGRNRARLEAVRDDLRVRGAARAEVLVEDLDAVDRHAALVDAAEALLGPADVVLLAQGALGDPAAYAADGAAAARVLHTNLVAPASLLTLFAARMEARGHGTLAAIGSVAGDRGRASNYAYGAAKGGLALFLQGLRNRLARAGVAVLTVKPGFVDTPMTAHLPRNALFADPERVATCIVRALDRRRDVVYAPGFWRWIMLAVRAIPERLFKRLSL
jgi:decaprenylphospho-beta-D-erythro-pentofuranosid-2-ulose 2-reductase